MLEAIVNNGYNKVSGNGEVAFIKPILPHITIINSRQNMKKKNYLKAQENGEK